MRVLVTGAAGFIGFHVARALLARGDAVMGFDNVNDYYDPRLKEARLAELGAAGGDWRFLRADLADRAAVDAAFADARFDRVIHLAAQAGVRYSLENPMAYVESNLAGFTHILEACRAAATPHLVFASTSSVYGGNTTMPFSRGPGRRPPAAVLRRHQARERADGARLRPSLPPALHRPALLHRLRALGPAGHGADDLRQAIAEGRPIRLFNQGRHSRDFTYVDDIADGVIRAADRIATPDPAWDPARPDPGTSDAPFRIYNIGNSAPVALARLHRRARARARPARRSASCCRCSPATCPTPSPTPPARGRATGWRPRTAVERGRAPLRRWFRESTTPAAFSP